VAGLGYIGAPAAIGWDHQPSGAGVLAHEFGHNFGRWHAPCGGPTGVDDAYPYAGARIGVHGYDIVSGIHKLPTMFDLMSYCHEEWISDYTYKAILAYRASQPMTVSARTVAGAATSAPGVLIWGRIENGQPILEPAIEVDAPASLPARSGPHRIDAFGPGGESLFTLSFNGERIADGANPNDQTFAFVVPASSLRGAALSRVRLTALGRQSEQRGSGSSATPDVLRSPGGRVRVNWDARAARMALIRDARTGQILSFARGGTVTLPTSPDELDITLSDGVRSMRTRARPR
jgi:hypothetical protein